MLTFYYFRICWRQPWGDWAYKLINFSFKYEFLTMRNDKKKVSTSNIPDPGSCWHFVAIFFSLLLFFYFWFFIFLSMHHSYWPIGIGAIDKIHKMLFVVSVILSTVCICVAVSVYVFFFKFFAFSSLFFLSIFV